MKSIFRLGILVLVAVLVALPVMTMQAQATDKQCFGLAAGDCDLLYSAFTPESGAQLAKGVSFDYNLAVKVGGAKPADVTLKGNGQFGMDGDKPLFSSDLTFGTKSGEQDMSIPLSIRVLTDKIYLNSMMITQGKWQFLPLKSAEAMGTQFSSSSPVGSASDPEQVQAVLKAMNAPGVVKSAVSEKSAADGTAVKEFSFDFDTGKFISSPELKPIIEESMKKNASESKVNLDEALPKIADALKDTTLNLSFQVGTDKVLRGLTFKMVSKMDEATLEELQKLGGTSSTSTMEGGLDLDLTFQLDFSKIGTAPSIETPEDAEELDLSGLFGGMGGSK